MQGPGRETKEEAWEDLWGKGGQCPRGRGRVEQLERRGAHQGIQINWEARGKGHQKIRLIVKTSRSEYKSYQL